MINRQALQKIKEEWDQCGRCPLHLSKRNYVHFRTVGDYDWIDILFVGEGPGVNEDIRGEPFVGEAGKLIEVAVSDALQKAHCGDNEISYMFANLVACRPCDSKASPNRPPLVPEISACRPHLQEIIKATEPAVIVFLGRVAQEHGPDALQDTDFKGTVHSIPHPAFLLYRGGSRPRETEIYREYVDRLARIIDYAVEETEKRIEIQDSEKSDQSKESGDIIGYSGREG